MKTEHFQYLLHVINYGSINKASQKLFLSQQQLSKIISALEEEFHTDILVRTSKGIQLTSEGKLIVERIEPLLNEINSLQELFAEKKYANLDGYLIIYKEPSIVSDKLATLISDIFTIHPQLKINLVESYFSHTLSALEKSQASIGIVHAFEEQLKEIPDELEFIPVLHRVPVVYTASTSNFYKQHNSTSLNALLEEAIIDYSISAQENDFLKALFSNHGTPNIKSSIGNLNSLLEILREGNMLYIGSCPIKHTPTISGISLLPIRDKTTIIQGLIVPKKIKNDPSIAYFIEKYLAFFEKYI